MMNDGVFYTHNTVQMLSSKISKIFMENSPKTVFTLSVFYSLYIYSDFFTVDIIYNSTGSTALPVCQGYVFAPVHLF
jgi:hypothetical protein